MTKTDKINQNKSSSEDKVENNLGQETENSIDKDISATKTETTEDKLKITEDKLLRTMAEMENSRRRFEKERQDAFEFGGFSFAKESLSLLDNIDRAVDSFKNDNNLKNNKDLDKIIDAINVIKNDLVSIFQKNNIDHIQCMGKKFDPNFHQAMLEIEDDTKDASTVVQEIQKGYMMKDRLLRPSLVGVTKKKTKKDTKTSNNGEKK